MSGKKVCFNPGHDTHHGHLPGNVIVRPAADVNLTDDAAHHTFGHDTHHKSGDSFQSIHDRQLDDIFKSRKEMGYTDTDPHLKLLSRRLIKVASQL